MYKVVLESSNNNSPHPHPSVVFVVSIFISSSYVLFRLRSLHSTGLYTRSVRAVRAYNQQWVVVTWSPVCDGRYDRCWSSSVEFTSANRPRPTQLPIRGV